MSSNSWGVTHTNRRNGMKLIWTFCLLLFGMPFGLAVPNLGLQPLTSTFGYDDRTRTSIPYDQPHASAFDYNSVSALIGKERENSTVGTNAVFTGFAEFVAAKTGVEAASKAIPRQITVLGSRIDSLAAKGWPGHNVLDIPNWSAKENIRWLDSAIRRGDEIYLATDPAKHRAILDSLPNRPFSAFLDLELPYLQSRGYIQQGLRMVPGP